MTTSQTWAQLLLGSGLFLPLHCSVLLAKTHFNLALQNQRIHWSFWILRTTSICLSQVKRTRRMNLPFCQVRRECPMGVPKWFPPITARTQCHQFQKHHWFQLRMSLKLTIGVIVATQVSVRLYDLNLFILVVRKMTSTSSMQCFTDCLDESNMEDPEIHIGSVGDLLKVRFYCGAFRNVICSYVNKKKPRSDSGRLIWPLQGL